MPIGGASSLAGLGDEPLGGGLGGDPRGEADQHRRGDVESDIGCAKHQHITGLEVDHKAVAVIRSPRYRELKDRVLAEQLAPATFACSEHHLLVADEKGPAIPNRQQEDPLLHQCRRGDRRPKRGCLSRIRAAAKAERGIVGAAGRLLEAAERVAVTLCKVVFARRDGSKATCRPTYTIASLPRSNHRQSAAWCLARRCGHIARKGQILGAGVLVEAGGAVLSCGLVGVATIAEAVAARVAVATWVSVAVTEDGGGVAGPDGNPVEMPARYVATENASASIVSRPSTKTASQYLPGPCRNGRLILPGRATSGSCSRSRASCCIGFPIRPWRSVVPFRRILEELRRQTRPGGPVALGSEVTSRIDMS